MPITDNPLYVLLNYFNYLKVMYVHYVILIDKVWAGLTLDDWGPKATTVNGFSFSFFLMKFSFFSFSVIQIYKLNDSAQQLRMSYRNYRLSYNIVYKNLVFIYEERRQNSTH